MVCVLRRRTGRSTDGASPCGSHEAKAGNLPDMAQLWWGGADYRPVLTAVSTGIQGWIASDTTLRRASRLCQCPDHTGSPSRFRCARALPASWASRPAAAATARDRPAAGRRSGTSGSSWTRCRRRRCAAPARRRRGHGLPIAAVHRHLRPERGDLLRKPLAASRAQPLGPLAEQRSRRVVQRARSRSSVSDCVSFSGDSRAACRISSE